MKTPVGLFSDLGGKHEYLCVILSKIFDTILCFH